MHTSINKKDKASGKVSQKHALPFFNPASSKAFIQAKLTVNQPGDSYEQEADVMADRVMRFSENNKAGKSITFQPTPISTIQRKCASCEEEEEEQVQRMESSREDSSLMRKVDGGGFHASPQLKASLHSSKGGGAPMPRETRLSMERSFGTDFSGVRVHSGQQATEMSQGIRAKAFTHGRDIYFNRGQYAPESTGGKRLLAHELTHVVQQNGSMCQPVIQQVPITGTISSIPRFEARQGRRSARQVRTTRSISGVNLRLSYDPATSLFRVTFPLIWIFPNQWATTRRKTYVQEFQSSVLGVWNNRFVLNETRRPPRRANVNILFDHQIIPQLANGALEEIRFYSASARQRWRMDVRNLHVRANVNIPTLTVELGSGSNQPTSRTTRQIMSLAQGGSFRYSGSGRGRTFTQVTSAHEFGHMIGLRDEYVDHSPGGAWSVAARGHINDRIMNVGGRVTQDAYQPFAAWLSELTSSTWRVGRRVRRR